MLIDIKSLKDDVLNKSNYPKVSVLCITYNQVQYIEKCLQSILAQTVDFQIEVLVHDDCSSDGTREVIEKYSFSYPNIIYPYFEDENQYSKGINIMDEILIPRARGEYIAFCEGDDYWIDPLKLQKQADFMDAHLEYSACLHNSIVCDYTSGVDYLSEPETVDDIDKPLGQIVMEGGGLINPTASFFFRKEKMIPSPCATPVGDHFRLMRLASVGKIRWLSSPMSVYRYGSASSFTKNGWGITEARAKDFQRAYIEALSIYKMKFGTGFGEEFDRRIDLQKLSLKADVEKARAVKAVESRHLRGSEVSAALFIKFYVRKHMPSAAWMRLRNWKTRCKCIRNHTLVSKTNKTYYIS